MRDKKERTGKFFFGAATSSHQVEGDNHNDWSKWEKKNAERLRKESGGKYPAENYISGRACDHYNRYEEDFDIAKSLGHNAHRFSIEWSRVEPEEGRFDEKEIEHYRQVIRALRARSMEPFVTLWHWTLPLWVRDKGGVNTKKFPYYFARFAERMAQEYKDDARFWIPINEPEIYSLNGYLRGVWPPQRRGLRSYFSAVRSLITAHTYAYGAIHKAQEHACVGTALNMSYFDSGGGFLNNVLVRAAEKYWNRYVIIRIQSSTDFIGLNYYFHNRIAYGFNKNENKTVSDLGWEVYPNGLYHVLIGLKKYNKPIYITENGIADAGDTKRGEFIREHLQWTRKAMDTGADVRGYFYWSLLDNFEWDKGFWPRFGLVEIDYQPRAGKTLERKIRPSAWEYKKIIEKEL